MDNILNVVATVQSTEDTGSQIVIKTADKKSYRFFKNKKDGQPTVAYQQMQDMEIKSGSTVSIGYKEVPYKDGTIKNVVSFREAAGVPVQQTITPQKPNFDTTGQIVSTPGRNFDREAYEKCCSIWAAQLNNVEYALTHIENGDFWKLFQAIRKDGEKRFATGWNRAEAIFNANKELASVRDEDQDLPPLSSFSDDPEAN